MAVGLQLAEECRAVVEGQRILSFYAYMYHSGIVVVFGSTIDRNVGSE